MALRRAEGSLESAETYKALLSEIGELIKREAEVSLTLLKVKHTIGLKLIEAKESLKYGDIFEFIKKVAADLNYSWGELYRCVRFAEKYPDFQGFLDHDFKIQERSETEPGVLTQRVKSGAELSWHQVANEPGVLVPPRSHPEPEQGRVSACVFNSEECAGEITSIMLCAVDWAEFQTWRNERKANPTP